MKHFVKDLYHACERFKCFHCKTDGNQRESRRMDSMMIESNIRKLPDGTAIYLYFKAGNSCK